MPSDHEPSTVEIPLFHLRGVTKAYPGVIALRSVDLNILAGEAHAIVGLNGAGKSTLVKILAGAVRADSGTITAPREDSVAGRSVNLVPQEIVMVPSFSIGRNILFGMEHKPPVRSRLDRNELALVSRALSRVGLEIHPETMPADCDVPELRLAQVAKALVSPGKVLLLDEPTAVLSEEDAERLVERVASLRDEGEAVVYVSHRIGEVVRLADRITVLRDGTRVAQLRAGELDREALIDLLSKHVTIEPPTGLDTSTGLGIANILEVRALSSPGFRNVDLNARAGEIVALVGVQDAGQSHLVQVLAGLRQASSGVVRVKGSSVDLKDPLVATRHGIVLVPSDRRKEGVVGSMDIRENVVLSPRSESHSFGFRRRMRERRTADGYIRHFKVKAQGVATKAAVLSGGNQQKVALAKALEARPEVLLLDEPTQGIDVATKGDILARIKGEARATGRPVVAATSELEEVSGWADTVLVFRQGEVVSRLQGSEVTEERLLQMAVS